ncbi:MAG TPA: envelope integrity protein Cei [Pseudonocardia sp.]
MVRNRPYQRRRRTPVLLLVGVLAVAAAVTWSQVLVHTGTAAGATTCPQPATGPAPGDVVAQADVAKAPPAPPSTVRVRVLNAGGQRGQANLVAAQFSGFGFAQAAPPTNDTFFPDGDMTCTGEIRFGKAGQAAASTVALLVPCAELIRDARPDDSVDVAVGTTFGDLNPGRPVRDALDQLGASGSGSDGSANADPAGNSPAQGAPVVDPATLAAARQAACS